MSVERQRGAVEKFRAMHASGCFVLPNPWDAGSAIYLAHLGFQALATTSAGLAFRVGVEDAVWAVPLEVTLAHVREIVLATELPVNADFQSAFAHEPEGVAENVKRCVATGVAGLSIEDATGDPKQPLYDMGKAVARIAAARRAIDETGVPVVLTARCEAWLVGQKDPLRTAIDRLTAYAEAGADCLFSPGVRKPDEIAAIVKAASPKPVNVLVSQPTPVLSVPRLAELGVRRVSVGSALARVAWGDFIEVAKSIQQTGSFDGLAGAVPFAHLNEVFTKHRGSS
jgi:2-methylisocitrate lyase-like PEP mutase family enzyme